MTKSDRMYLNFESNARRAFSFLEKAGFSETKALPTLVCYQKDGVEIDIYHGRQSYEIGIDVSSMGMRYSMSEIIRANDPAEAKRYRNVVASTPDGIVTALQELSSLMKRYGAAVLHADPRFFSALKEQRFLWAEEFSLDVLAKQLRPEAEEAFKRGDYSKASDLYSRIRTRLTPAEVKKLIIAEERCN